MQKFVCLSVVVLLLATVYAGAPANYHRSSRTRQFARQEVAEDVPLVTPYPSADEIKPEVPFDEAAAASSPDEVYGPPGAVNSLNSNQPDEVYGPPQADEVYGPPQADEVPLAEINPQSARLTANRRQYQQRSARLQNNRRRL